MLKFQGAEKDSDVNIRNHVFNDVIQKWITSDLRICNGFGTKSCHSCIFQEKPCVIIIIFKPDIRRFKNASLFSQSEAATPCLI